MSVYQKFRNCKTARPFYALVGCLRKAREPHTLTGRGKSPFHPCSRHFVLASVLKPRKNAPAD